MKTIIVALAAGALTVSAGAASAAPGRTTTDLNLRNGPGTGYGIITTMPEGARVNIRNCSGSWCRVNFRGTSGWAAANLLNETGGGYARGGYRTYRSDAPDYAYVSPRYGYGSDYGYSYGPDLSYAYEPGISFGFGVGPGWGGGWHHGWRRW